MCKSWWTKLRNFSRTVHEQFLIGLKCSLNRSWTTFRRGYIMLSGTRIVERAVLWQLLFIFKMYGSLLILLIRLLHVDIHVATAFVKTTRIIAYFKHCIEKKVVCTSNWKITFTRFNYERLELEIRNELQRQIYKLHPIVWRRHFGDVYWNWHFDDGVNTDISVLNRLFK